jgi:transcriptional regulator with XRE-family HTH domain
MTQKDLSEKAGITFTYISRLEAGGAAVSIDMLQRLAKALEVEITGLLPGSEEKEVSVEDLRRQFEALLLRVGPETRSALSMVLARFSDSTTAKR